MIINDGNGFGCGLEVALKVTETYKSIAWQFTSELGPL